MTAAGTPLAARVAIVLLAVGLVASHALRVRRARALRAELYTRDELLDAALAGRNEAARLKQLLGAGGSLIELNRALSEKIAKGEVGLQTPGLAEHLWQTTMDKLAVDQPNYASYKRELGES